MRGGKRLMYLGVVDLLFPSFFVFPGVVAPWVPGYVVLGSRWIHVHFILT